MLASPAQIQRNEFYILLLNEACDLEDDTQPDEIDSFPPEISNRVHETRMLFSRIVFQEKEMISVLLCIAGKFARYHARVEIPEALHISLSRLELMLQVLQTEFPLMENKCLSPIDFSGPYVRKV